MVSQTVASRENDSKVDRRNKKTKESSQNTHESKDQKKKDVPPTSNTDQNKQADDAKKEIEQNLGRKLSKDEKRRFHDHITGQRYNYHELVEEGYWLFRE